MTVKEAWREYCRTRCWKSRKSVPLAARHIVVGRILLAYGPQRPQDARRRKRIRDTLAGAEAFLQTTAKA